MSFKSGDKVELVEVDYRYSNEVGDVGVVISVNDAEATLYVKVEGRGYYTWHQEYTKKVKGESDMSVKYYRNLKDNFLWLEGAILSDENEADGYQPINDLWDKTEKNGSEYISRRIVEAEENKDCFERVYPIGDIKKMLFGNKAAARAAVNAGAYKAEAKKKSK